jgi:hypothetical protein
MSRPDRGEVWLVDLGYVAKTRPCLVLSVPILDTDRALAKVIPHTTSPRETRFEVAVPQPFLRPGVFDGQESNNDHAGETDTKAWRSEGRSTVAGRMCRA